MKTTILTIEKEGQCYYFDLNTNSGRIYVSWFEKQLRSFDNLNGALLWFINTHSDYQAKNIDENYINIQSF